MSGDYVKAKEAALHGEVYFDYLTGPGYSRLARDNVGVSESLDFAQVNATVGRESVNLPRTRRDLHNDKAQHEGPGFHAWSPYEVARDMAPKFVNRKLEQSGNVGRMMEPQVFDDEVHNFRLEDPGIPTYTQDWFTRPHRVVHYQ